MLKRAFRIGQSALDYSGDGQRTVSRRRERCFMLKLAFRVDESALDDPGDGQRTVSRRRERCFMLKRWFRIGESATDGRRMADGPFRVDESEILC